MPHKNSGTYNPAFLHQELWKQYFYDTASSAAMAAGQRNLHGKLSYSEAYRFGIPIAIYYYSYDEMGRVECRVIADKVSYQKKLTGKGYQ
jgi:hypothetical protein